MERFERLGRAIGTSEEARVLEAIYLNMPARNFSSDLLQQLPDRVAVTELTNALWSDWGRPERIAKALPRIGRTPAFPLKGSQQPIWTDSQREPSRCEGLNRSHGDRVGVK